MQLKFASKLSFITLNSRVKIVRFLLGQAVVLPPRICETLFLYFDWSTWEVDFKCILLGIPTAMICSVVVTLKWRYDGYTKLFARIFAWNSNLCIATYGVRF